MRTPRSLKRFTHSVPTGIQHNSEDFYFGKYTLSLKIRGWHSCFIKLRHCVISSDSAESGIFVMPSTYKQKTKAESRFFKNCLRASNRPFQSSYLDEKKWPRMTVHSRRHPAVSPSAGPHQACTAADVKSAGVFIPPGLSDQFQAALSLLCPGWAFVWALTVGWCGREWTRPWWGWPIFLCLSPDPLLGLTDSEYKCWPCIIICMNLTAEDSPLTANVSTV